MAYSGKFTPKNPQKYIGDYNNIVYRSSWECKVMDWLDRNDNIISWASEELIIPYLSPADNKYHRYFPDFLVKAKTRDEAIEKAIGMMINFDRDESSELLVDTTEEMSPKDNEGCSTEELFLSWESGDALWSNGL